GCAARRPPARRGDRVLNERVARVEMEHVTTFGAAPGPTSPQPAPGVLDPGLRRVFEAADLAVATVDTEGHVVSATSAFAAHFGRTIEPSSACTSSGSAPSPSARR